MSNLVQEKPKFSVAIQSDAYKKLINNTLGDPKKSQRFIASISSAVATTPALQDCDAGSILSCALLGEALGLSPSPQLGHFYLIPYKDNKNNKTNAQFQLGYKGYIQLAIRSGQYTDLDVIEVREGEFLGRDKMTGKFKFEFLENEEERVLKPIVGYLGYFELLNGFKKTLYMSKKEMEMHADTFSKAFNLKDYEKLKQGQIPKEDLWKFSSFWYKNFDEMAFKTVIRRLLSKWGVMSIEMQEAFNKDMAVLHENGDYEYVDNPSYDTQNDIQEAEIIEPKKKVKLDDVM